MATGTNGIATVSELVAKGLKSIPGYASNQCPPKEAIVNGGGDVPSTYASDQLVKYTDVSITFRDFIVYNWGSVPIYNIQFTLENSSSLESQTIYMGGSQISAGGGYAYSTHNESIIGTGSGNIRVVGPVIVNGGSWTFTGKIHLSAVTTLTGGTQPINWNNSIGAYYFVSGSYKLKIDLKFPN